MGLPGWNPSTLKVLEGDTGLICEGCCDGGTFCVSLAQNAYVKFYSISLCQLNDGDGLPPDYNECTAGSWWKRAYNENDIVNRSWELDWISGDAGSGIYGKVIKKFTGTGSWSNYDYYYYVSLSVTCSGGVQTISGLKLYARRVLNSPPIWLDNHSYSVGTYVKNASTLVEYICTQSHTSSTSNDKPATGTNWADYWSADSGFESSVPADIEIYDAEETFDFFIGGSTVYTADPTTVSNSFTDVDDCCENNAGVYDHYVNGYDGSCDVSLECNGFAWADETYYFDEQIVTNITNCYRAKSNHTSASSNEPGAGLDWTDYWELAT